MALLAGGRTLSSILLGSCSAGSIRAASSMQLQRALGSSNSSSSSEPPAPGTPDPFTRSLQSKTEEEVLSLLEKAKLQQQQAQEDEEDNDMVSVVNPETGEVYGPRGKEPTRFGDWEIKGRCTDFA